MPRIPARDKHGAPKPMARSQSHVPGGAALFQRMFTRLGFEGRPPRFRVEFYPYSSLVLTIRRREESLYVRFSDLLLRAPLQVLESAAALLLTRVYRHKAPAVLTAPYLEYARSHRTRARPMAGRARVVACGAPREVGCRRERRRIQARTSARISDAASTAAARECTPSFLSTFLT